MVDRSYDILFLFEDENEEKRNRDGRNNNVIKWQGAKFSEDKFYIGSPDINDPYSGSPIYVPSKEQLLDIEAREKAAREQITEFKETGHMSTGSEMQNKDSQVESQNTDSQVSDSSNVFDTSGMSEEDLKTANEIYMRLMNEAAADEAARQAEIEAIKAQQEVSENASDKDYNAATGSYSGLYGKKPMSQDEADVYANIMNDNNSYKLSIDDLLKEGN